MTTTRAYDTAPVLCPGGTVVCLATGPSLTADDVNACRGRATVIAINDAWRLAPWADVLYSSDRHWYPHHDWVPEFPGRKIAMEITPHDGVLVLQRTGETGLELAPTGLKSYKNSGGAAINLAVHLGASRILLLGYDMGATGVAHFFGSHPRGLRTTGKATYVLFRQLMATMVEPLRARGITVVNCTRTSALDCFPRQSLDQTLPAREAVAS
jgi:hypothetical protein